MDRRERLNDVEETTRVAQDGMQARLWTALPGIIEAFDSSKMTAKVQPSIQMQLRSVAGVWSTVSLPLLLDCPVVFPGGGGWTLTFPLTVGDECLVVFASRCIDAWWQSGGVQPQAEFRMHDLSDGFVLPGVRSQPRRFTVAATARLTNDAGSLYLETAADGFKIQGNLHVTGDVIAGTVSLEHHVHDNTQTASAGNHSGPPVP